MKKIGFVDYYISEWHANSYPAWIAKACEENGLSYEVAYAWAEEYISPYDGRNTDEWCRDFGATRCDSIRELCEKSDVVVILAPSNPEKHLGYALEVFKYARLVYVDKTFAPDLKTAKQIYEIAEQYGTRFFSTSALRYATELAKIDTGVGVATTGGGSNLPEYVIHQVEMVVKLMGGAVRILARMDGGATVFDAEYADGRRAEMRYSPELSFTVRGLAGDEPTAISSPFFVLLITDMLRFFESGESSFSSEETLEAMRMREAAILASERLGEWIYLDSI